MTASNRVNDQQRSTLARTIENVLQDYSGQWMKIAGVVGTAIGEYQGKPCILILTSVSDQEVQPHFPAEIEGFLVIIQNVGHIEIEEN